MAMTSDLGISWNTVLLRLKYKFVYAKLKKPWGLTMYLHGIGVKSKHLSVYDIIYGYLLSIVEAIQ